MEPTMDIAPVQKSKDALRNPWANVTLSPLLLVLRWIQPPRPNTWSSMRSAYPTKPPKITEKIITRYEPAFNAIPRPMTTVTRPALVMTISLKDSLITFFSNKPTKVPAITARQFT
jgi:hypothetical protein